MTYDVVIIGGGLSGLTTAYTLLQQMPGCRLVLIESQGRLGGVVQTVSEQGYLLESGPNSIQGRAKGVLTMAQELDLPLVTASPIAKKRYIYWGRKLHIVPITPMGFLFSELLSPVAKLRLLMEPLLPGRKGNMDESVADFTRRRLGADVLRNLLGPFLSGIYAGDPELLSLRSIFPQLSAWEQESGSLLKGFLGMRKARRKKPAAEKPAGHTLLSFEGGLQSLPDALAARISSERIRLNAEIASIQRLSDAGYRVTLANGETLESRSLILATPAKATATLLANVCPDMVTPLNEIPYAPLAVVHLGFQPGALKHPLDGFGFLTAQEANLPLLGCTWSSSIFPNRAPAEYKLLTAYVGGIRFPELVYRRTPDAILADTLTYLQDVFNQHSLEPAFFRVFYHERAIPQYTVGHQERLDRFANSLKNTPGLFLCGNYFTGVSLEGTANSGIRAAQQSMQYLAQTSCRLEEQPVG